MLVTIESGADHEIFLYKELRVLTGNILQCFCDLPQSTESFPVRMGSGVLKGRDEKWGEGGLRERGGMLLIT